MVFQSYSGRKTRFLRLHWIDILPEVHSLPHSPAFLPSFARLEAILFQSYVGRDTVCAKLSAGHGDTLCVSVVEVVAI
jgi:hypothetical protein